MGDTLGIKNQGDRAVWEEPDPRVKWALDLFDDQGYETLMWHRQYIAPASAGGFGLISSIGYNMSVNLPVRARIPIHAASFAFGWGVASFFMSRRAQRRAEQEAAAKHYIMLHPDRFPEPEMIKFGDKRCVLPWKINRPVNVEIDPFPHRQKE